MPTRIVINGREVESPAAKAFIALLALLVCGALGTFVFFLLLPLLGIALGLSVALVGVALFALMLGLPLLMLAGIFSGGAARRAREPGAPGGANRPRTLPPPAGERTRRRDRR